MTSPSDIAAFHADYDRHPDDRVRLFSALADILPASSRVLYPGSYVDIAPSVWFDEVTYVDTDKRAATFFERSESVTELIDSKRRRVDRPTGVTSIDFHHADYREPLPEPDESFDLLVSLYAGFISEHCTKHLRIGGTLLVNPSHGDAAMASIDPRYVLTAVVTSSKQTYRIRTADLDSYMEPKKEQTITIDSLHESGRGIAYTRSAFAYLFTKQPSP